MGSRWIFFFLELKGDVPLCFLYACGSVGGRGACLRHMAAVGGVVVAVGMEVAWQGFFNGSGKSHGKGD